MNKLLDFFSQNLAVRKGLLPLIGLALIVINLILQFVPGAGWLAQTNLFLHVGLVVVVFGFLLAWAL